MQPTLKYIPRLLSKAPNLLELSWGTKHLTPWERNAPNVPLAKGCKSVVVGGGCYVTVEDAHSAN